MIRFATCARRKNGRIIGIGTVQRGSFGKDEHQYWPASRIFDVQDTIEISRYTDPTDSQEKTVDLGPYQFVARSEDHTRSVDMRAEGDSDEFYMAEPITGDRDLVTGLQECPGEYPTSD